MKKIRIILSVLALILFIVIIVFTNDHVEEQISYANAIVTASGISSLIIALISVVLTYIPNKEK